MLDSRALKSPAGKPLVLPSRLLALAVAAEWEQQAGDFFERGSDDVIQAFPSLDQGLTAFVLVQPFSLASVPNQRQARWK